MSRRSLLFSSGGSSYPIDAYVFQVGSDIAPIDAFTINTIGGGYDYDIKTSDGQEFFGVTGNQAITFPELGIYIIEITGDFPKHYINNGSQRQLMRDIIQWGDVGWSTNQSNCYYGCTFLTVSATDSPFANVIQADSMFRRCFSIVLTEFMDFESVTDGNSMFRECNNAINIPLGMEFSSLQRGANLFFQITGTITAPSLNFESLPAGGFPSGIANAFYNGVVSTVDYSNILIRAEANNPNNNIRFDAFQLSKYNSSAVTARANLVSRGWTLSDAGLE